jgi:geranylgeranyl reductase family protein
MPASLNRPFADLPERCDVLVVGAGPAGSAAAQWLARAGRDTVLVDAQAFPRDKVCGDGLIPDAHRALERLGVLGAVMAEARQSDVLTCVAPRGGRIDVPGRLAVLPRKRLDQILLEAAAAAGARMHAPVRFVEPVQEGGRVVGAVLEHEGARRTVRAGHVVLATGAQPQATIAAGLCERRTPSGIALRGYVVNPAMESRITSLEVVWHPKLAPGYGWIFPCGNGTFNIGVGVAQSHREGKDGRHAMKDVNLRDVFAAFQSLYANARDLVAGREVDLKGAPLRCSLEGAALARPGLLVTGEAAGSTYAFTGEGIGKAMETGLHAAEALLASDDDAAIRADYAARVAALKPRFALYEQANKANEKPWLIDLLVWSAKRSPRRLQRMAGVLEETHIPTDAVSWRGILRRLVDWR